MRIVLINPRGFCAGVTMAVKCLDITLRRLGWPIYVYHEIVHNQHVVKEFQSRGAVFVERLSVPRDAKLAWLTQTTLSVDESSRIITRLKERFPQIVGPPNDDICYATQNRQQALREGCEQADVVVVVGSRNSSNSRRLAELAMGRGITAHLVNDSSQLNTQWFRPEQTVVVTAGASAPEAAVQAVVDWLAERFDAQVEQLKGVVEEQVFPLPSNIRGSAPAGNRTRRKALA